MTFVERADNAARGYGRLVPFEEYMFADGLSAYPMSCYILLRFRGHGDESALQEAMSKAVRLHPLLCGSVERRRRGAYFWRKAEPAIIFRRAPDGTAESFFEPAGPESGGRRFRFVPAFEAGGIDLFNAPALRIHYWTSAVPASEAQTYLFVELHHSASDATGFFRFLEDALIEYARMSGAKIPSAPSYDESLLKRRHSYYRSWREKIRLFPRQLFGLERGRAFLLRRVRPLARPDFCQEEKTRFAPAFLNLSLTRDETAALLSEAKKRAATLNDLFLAAVFRGMRDALDDPRFFDGRAQKKERGYLRIAVPINLRGKQGGKISAANLSSMVFVDRLKEKITDGDAFLERIHHEMAHIKKNELGFAFVHGLTFFKKLLGGFELMCGGDRCWTTGTVSNLGVLFRRSPLAREDGGIVAGNLELFDVQAAPPIRRGSVFGVSAETYAGALRFGMQYDAKILSAARADILFAAIEKHLRFISPITEKKR